MHCTGGTGRVQLESHQPCCCTAAIWNKYIEAKVSIILCIYGQIMARNGKIQISCFSLLLTASHYCSHYFALLLITSVITAQYSPLILNTAPLLRSLLPVTSVITSLLLRSLLLITSVVMDLLLPITSEVMALLLPITSVVMVSLLPITTGP